MTCAQIPWRPRYDRGWSALLDGHGDSTSRPIAFLKHPVATRLVGLLDQLSGRQRAINVLLWNTGWRPPRRHATMMSDTDARIWHSLCASTVPCADPARSQVQ